MPFLVALTKNGNLSILVTSTKPPLLSTAPKWMAARQILDSCDKYSEEWHEGHSLSMFVQCRNVRFRMTYHIIKESTPHISFLIQNSLQDIYICRFKKELATRHWFELGRITVIIIKQKIYIQTTYKKNTTYTYIKQEILTCCKLLLCTCHAAWFHT